MEASVEVWKSTARGMRWVQVLNNLGNPVGRVVQPNKTFSITTRDRKLNQDMAASPKQDLFRNGTFLIVTPGPETDEQEFASPEAMTDAEITSLVQEIKAEHIQVGPALHRITSVDTTQRIYEAMVVENAGEADVKYVKDRLAELKGGPPVRRAAAAPSDTNVRVPDTSKFDGSKDEGESVASPGREIIPERVK